MTANKALSVAEESALVKKNPCHKLKTEQLQSIVDIFKSHILPWRLKKTSAKLFFKNSIFCYFSFVVYILISESFKMIQKEIDKIYNQLHVIFLIFESLTASYKTTVCAIILTCGENKLSFIWKKVYRNTHWGNVLKNNHRFNKKCILKNLFNFQTSMNVYWTCVQKIRIAKIHWEVLLVHVKQDLQATGPIA